MIPARCQQPRPSRGAISVQAAILPTNLNVRMSGTRFFKLLALDATGAILDILNEIRLFLPREIISDCWTKFFGGQGILQCNTTTRAIGIKKDRIEKAEKSSQFIRAKIPSLPYIRITVPWPLAY